MLTLHERTDEGLSDCIHSRVTNDLHVYGTLAHTELPRLTLFPARKITKQNYGAHVINYGAPYRRSY